MTKRRMTIALPLLLAAASWMLHAAAEKFDVKHLLTGQAAFIDGRAMKPATFRKVTVDALPPPFATSSSANPPRLVPRPANAWPQAPAGFKVDLYTTNLDEPREIRTAPNGDLFVAETHLGQIKIFRGRDKDGKPQQVSVFSAGIPSRSWRSWIACCSSGVMTTRWLIRCTSFIGRTSRPGRSLGLWSCWPARSRCRRRECDRRRECRHGR